MNLKDRVIEFLKYLQIGQDKFEKKVGLSSGFVNKIGDSIRKKNLDKILLAYPELNINWLMTGIEPMLLNQSTVNKPETQYACRDCKKKDEKISEWEKRYFELQEKYFELQENAKNKKVS